MLRFALLLASALPLAAIAQTDDAALLRCAQAADAATRLRCFDALADQARQRLAAPPSAATPDPKKVAEFGRPPKPDASDLDEVASRIPGRFEGWGPRQRFTLANGQTWEISDDSSAFANVQNPAVKIRRGALGSYFMDIDGVRKAPRVKRVD